MTHDPRRYRASELLGRDTRRICDIRGNVPFRKADEREFKRRQRERRRPREPWVDEDGVINVEVW